MKRISIFISLVLFATPWALADTDTTGSKSVYTINPWVDGPVLGVAALGASVPIFFQDQIVYKHCPCDRDDVPAIDRPVIEMHSEAAAWSSHFLVTAAIGIPAYLDYKDVDWSRTLAEDFTVYAEVLAIDSSLSNLARYTVQRPRPEAYRQTPDPDDTGAFLSFYSGHAASAVAALSAASMTYHYRYGPHVWPWIVTGTVGLTEAYLRSAAGKHFYTDDIVGLIVGTGVGLTVPMLHHRKDKSSTVMMVPADRGAVMVWKKTF